MEFDIKDPKTIGLFTFIGAILMIVAYFVDWASITSYVANHSVGTVNIDAGDIADADDWQKYIPMLGLVFGIIIVVIELLNFFVPGALDKLAAIIPIIVFVFGILAVVFAIMFMTWDVWDSHMVAGNGTKSSMGLGFYLLLAGGIVTLIFSIGQAIPAIKALGKN